MQPLINLFKPISQCFKRTKEQKLFEERLYREGLEKEIKKVIQTINTETIRSKDIALKFMLQELDILRKGDIVSQRFVERSGFHLAEYLGTAQKFEEDRAEIKQVQDILLNFLDQISDEKIMLQSAKTILNGVMEYWGIGKYSEEGKLFVKEEKDERKPSISKKSNNLSSSLYFKKLQKVVMNKLIYADNQIQKLLDMFASTPIEIKQEKPTVKKEQPPIKEVEPTIEKEEKIAKKEQPIVEKIEPTVKIYNDKKIYDLMEEYSLVIENIITGKITPENHKEVAQFQEQMILALREGNNLASVFYPFFDSQSLYPAIDFPITKMDNKSKKFFIDILNSFGKRGFSVNLHRYLHENQEDVYRLASQGDRFMQYLIDFWYEESDSKEKVEKV